jgi:hypothetical protein
LTGGNHYYAAEVVEKGHYSFASDMFGMGMVLQDIVMYDIGLFILKHSMDSLFTIYTETLEILNGNMLQRSPNKRIQADRGLEWTENVQLKLEDLLLTYEDPR